MGHANTFYRRAFPAVAALFVIVILSACGVGSAEPGRKPSPDWSRGVPLTADVKGTVGMSVAGASDAVNLAWPVGTEDARTTLIHYQRLDGEANTIVDRDLELPSGLLRTSRLLQAANDQTHLFWASRIGPNWELWHVLLDALGDLVASPSQLSPSEISIGDYVVAQNEAGDGFVVWENVSDGGLWANQLTGAGIDTEPFQLTPEGELPGALVADNGDLHLAWFESGDIHYAVVPGDGRELAEGTVVVDLEYLPSTSMDSPVVGLADGWLYIVWSSFARSGLEANTGKTEFVAFPAGAPGPSRPERLPLTPLEEQPYEAYAGSYPLTVLAPPAPSPSLSADYVLEPHSTYGRGSEVAMVVSSKQEARLETIIQMALILFEEGQFKGFQMAAKTENFSQDGLLAADSAGNLHLAWREGAGNRLYYASTAPGVKGGLNRLGVGDLFSTLLGGGLEAMVGALFFPLALIWLVPGFALLGVWKLRRDDETVQERSSRVVLVVALILYQATKILFLPSILSYVPFSAWYDVPRGIESTLQIAVPVVIFLMGILVAELFRRRNETMSTLLYFFIVCAVDALLTLGVYGVNYLGVL
jgi:hypothetical protein